MRILAAPVDIGQELGSPWGSQGFGLGQLISVFLTTAISVAGIIVVFFIVFAGIGIIQSAGSGDAKGSEQSKKTLTYAILGFVIIFTSYWFIRIIEIILGVDLLTNPGFLIQQLP